MNEISNECPICGNETDPEQSAFCSDECFTLASPILSRRLSIVMAALSSEELQALWDAVASIVGVN